MAGEGNRFFGRISRELMCLTSNLCQPRTRSDIWVDGFERGGFFGGPGWTPVELPWAKGGCLFCEPICSWETFDRESCLGSLAWYWGFRLDWSWPRDFLSRDTFEVNSLFSWEFSSLNIEFSCWGSLAIDMYESRLPAGVPVCKVEWIEFSVNVESFSKLSDTPKVWFPQPLNFA